MAVSKQLLAKIRELENRSNRKTRKSYTLVVDKPISDSHQPIKVAPNHVGESETFSIPISVAEDFVLLDGEVVINGLTSLDSAIISKVPTNDADVVNKKYVDSSIVDMVIGDDLTVTDDLYVGDNIYLTSDASALYFGVDAGDTIMQVNNNGFNFIVASTNTNSVNQSFIIGTSTTGTAAAGFGGKMIYRLENGAGNLITACSVGVKYTDVTSTSEDATFFINVVSDGTSTERLTLDHAGNLAIDGDLTVSGQDIDLSSTTGSTILTDVYQYFRSDHSSPYWIFTKGGTGLDNWVCSVLSTSVTNTIYLYNPIDESDQFGISCADNAETTITTADNVGGSGSEAHLILDIDGHVEFDGCGVGFDKNQTLFATAAVTSEGDDSTDIDFRLGNKHQLLLTDNIAGSGEHINMVFPATSGNFLLAVVQDGTGSRTVHSDGWKAYASDETLCDNTLGANLTDGEVRWAGGIAPTLTTTLRKTDIVSIYWDADNQTACATITQDF